MKSHFLLFVLTFFLASCSAIVKVDGHFPHIEQKNTQKEAYKIVLLPLVNYTDTPHAGSRASNLIAGVLRAYGYSVTLKESSEFSQKALKKARQEGATYLLHGGVSEWRYKTGIDGEAAVSLMLTLVDTQSGSVVWSATASDTSWNNSSLGTVAQKLIEKMIVD